MKSVQPPAAVSPIPRLWSVSPDSFQLFCFILSVPLLFWMGQCLGVQGVRGGEEWAGATAGNRCIRDAICPAL